MDYQSELKIYRPSGDVFQTLLSKSSQKNKTVIPHTIFEKKRAGLKGFFKVYTYGKDTKKIISELKVHGIFSPTDLKDHIATPFILLDLNPAEQPGRICITIGFPTGQPLASRIRISVQDEKFNSLYEAIVVPPLLTQNENNEILFQELVFTIKVNKIRIVMQTLELEPFIVPLSIRIEQLVNV